MNASWCCPPVTPVGSNACSHALFPPRVPQPSSCSLLGLSLCCSITHSPTQLPHPNLAHPSCMAQLSICLLQEVCPDQPTRTGSPPPLGHSLSCLLPSTETSPPQAFPFISVHEAPTRPSERTVVRSDFIHLYKHVLYPNPSGID